MPGDELSESGDLSLDMLMAALRADSTVVAIYARVLTESLGAALPPGCVTVDRERSMSDRMRGRPGEVSKVTVRLGDQVLSLGVQPVALGQWVQELARALMVHAEENAAAAQALRRLVAGG